MGYWGSAVRKRKLLTIGTLLNEAEVANERDQPALLRLAASMAQELNQELLETVMKLESARTKE